MYVLCARHASFRWLCSHIFNFFYHKSCHTNGITIFRQHEKYRQIYTIYIQSWHGFIIHLFFCASLSLFFYLFFYFFFVFLWQTFFRRRAILARTQCQSNCIKLLAKFYRHFFYMIALIDKFPSVCDAETKIMHRQRQNIIEINSIQIKIQSQMNIWAGFCSLWNHTPNSN